MKKIICILICLGMVLALVGCRQPSLPDNAKELAGSVVEVTEQYLQHKIDSHDAFTLITSYRELLESIPEPEDPDQSTDLLLLKTDVLLLETNILLYAEDSEIKKYLNKIKKYL